MSRDAIERAPIEIGTKGLSVSQLGTYRNNALILVITEGHFEVGDERLSIIDFLAESGEGGSAIKGDYRLLIDRNCRDRFFCLWSMSSRV